MKRGSFRPQHIGVRFGAGGNLPAFRIDTPKGKTALLHGKIDRIDRVADPSGDAAIMDYRLGDPKLAIGMALHGLSLQLLSYLLVLKSAGQAMASEKPMAPAAAFYLPLIRKIESVAHPDDAPTPDHPDFNLKNKPRGILDQRCLPKLDKDLIKTGGASKVVQAFIKKDGHLGKQNNSDVVASDDFRALLAKMLDKLGELADKILSGAIDVLPYKLNDQSPCSRCAYRDVCRFDPAINRYNVLKPIQREQALAEDDDE
jgi:ATP-dependent helicase/nuclease subunit B